MVLKLCTVGCGQFAELCHGPVQRSRAESERDVELAGCCDQAKDRAEHFRQRFGYARAYDDVSGMLAAERPDALVVAVPPAVTARVAAPIFAAGIPVLLEKPPGLDSGELAALQKAAEAGKTRVQVAFNRRYMPVIVEAQRRLARWGEAAVSRIEYAMVRRARFNEDFSTTAVHAIDALLHLARSPLAAVELRFQVQREGEQSVINVELRGETRSGIQLFLAVLPNGGSNRETAVIHGRGRRLHVDIPASPLANEPGTLTESAEGKPSAAYTDATSHTGMLDRMGIAGEFAAFLAGVPSGAALSPCLADCAPAVALMAAMRAGQTHPSIA
ncbi:MAG TPA: Gfo/Idh/MocA family oxidoreductase [Opitutaceae bacterium]